MKTSLAEVRKLLLDNDYCALAFCGENILRFKLPGSQEDNITEIAVEELTDGWVILTINEQIYTCRTFAARVLARSVLDVTLLGKFSYDPRFMLIYNQEGDLLEEITSFESQLEEYKIKEKELFYAYDKLKQIIKYPEYAYIEKEERDGCIKEFKEFYEYSELKPSIDTIKDVMTYLYDNLEDIL